MIKIKAGNERHVDNMGCSIAKLATIFLGNAEIDYFKLKLVVHVLIRVSPGIETGKAANKSGMVER